MSEQSSGVGTGTLSGINLSGDDAPEAALPQEDDRTLAGAAAEATSEPEGVTAVPEVEVPEADAPEETAAAPAKKTGAPARPYVILKEEVFEGTEDTYLTKVHEVEARNAQNAMRQAFKDLSLSGDTAEAVLVVIPKSMFRPTKVRLNKTERVSVAFG